MTSVPPRHPLNTHAGPGRSAQPRASRLAELRRADRAGLDRAPVGALLGRFRGMIRGVVLLARTPPAPTPAEDAPRSSPEGV